MTDITIIICTFNRAESLRITLSSILRARRESIPVSIIVVDNNSEDHTKSVVESIKNDLNVRYLFEPRQGKAFCLNRALDLGGFGEIVAFLDDDMTVERDWIQGVSDISGRHPDAEIFTGNSYVIWPERDIPKWAKTGKLNDWGMSVQNRGNTDKVIVPNRWPGGGHFWIRSSALASGARFDEPIVDEIASNIYVSDPDFIQQLFSLGFKGISGPDTVVGHRVQRQLIEKSYMRRRAVTVGRSIPYIRGAYPAFFKGARILRKSAMFFGFGHFLKFLSSLVKYASCLLIRDKDARFACQMEQLAQISNNFECIMHTRRVRIKLLSNEAKLNRLRRKHPAV
jgi:glucosyl-dolichyl phosphate glucuronosyltransferase